MPDKIGQLLRHTASLTRHDIEEILHEQHATGHRFGQIAVEMGLCRSEDVWSAWSAQLTDSPQPIDLADIGVDSQAIFHVPPDVALTYGIIPIRAFDQTLILATTSDNHARAALQLPSLLQYDLKFVLISSEQLADALFHYYLPLAAIA